MVGRMEDGASEPKQVFADYFPTATIEEIDLDQIPAAAMEYFEKKSQAFVNRHQYVARNFESAWVILHKNGYRTYVVKQTKTYGREGDTEELIYLVDTNNTGEKVGHGEIRFNISNPIPYFKDKPFVGFTETLEGHRRQGHGTRRLLEMNALTHMCFGLPLHSDTLFSPGNAAESLWKKLVANGEAQTYQEGPYNRYRFKDQ